MIGLTEVWNCSKCAVQSITAAGVSWFERAANRAATDGSGDKEYVETRLLDAWRGMRTAQPPMLLLRVMLQGVLQYSTGGGVAAAAKNLLIPVVINAMIYIFDGPLHRFYQDHFREVSIAVQVGLWGSNLAWGILVAQGSFLEQRIFLIVMPLVIFGSTHLLYVPDKVFYPIYPATLMVGWALFDIRAGQGYTSSICEGVFMGAAIIRLRRHLVEKNWQAFVVGRELEEARAGMQDMMSAQQCLLSSLFDASCTCDPELTIARATPQMAALLGSRQDLAGQAFPSLMAGEESGRVQKFLESAWKDRTVRTTVIQTSLSAHDACGIIDDPGGRPAAAPVEVKLYCVRLPSTQPGLAMESPSGQLWAHGGLFLGLQEAAPAAATGSDAAASALTERLEDDRHLLSVTFEADSAGFEVLCCSPELEGAGVVPGCSLKEVLPQKYRRAFDDFVYDQMQQAHEEAWQSGVLDNLVLEPSWNPGIQVKARRAWLELPDGRDSFPDACMPVVLRLDGLRRKRVAPVPSQSSLHAIQEDFAESEVSESLVSTHEITPFDSASQISDRDGIPRFRLLARREAEQPEFSDD